MELLLNADSAILIWIQENIRNEYLTPIVRVITHTGDKGILWIVMLLTMMLFKKTRKTAILTSVVLLITFIITNILLKPTVARIRPYEIIENLTILIPKPSDYSFPSGHTANSMAVCIMLWLIGKNHENADKYDLYFPQTAGTLLLILSVLISLSRLYLGVHYPTDVLGGFLIAVTVSLLCYVIFKKYAAKSLS